MSVDQPHFFVYNLKNRNRDVDIEKLHQLQHEILQRQIALNKDRVTIIISGIFISLSRVDIVFLFWSLFPVFPHIQTFACLCYSQSNFIGSYFLYSSCRQTFSVLFYMGFYWLFFG